MDVNLEDDDDMLLIVIGNDSKKDSNNSITSTKLKYEIPVEETPCPVTIKVEPLEEDEVVSINVENIIRTAAEHDLQSDIKQEQPDDNEIPVISKSAKTINKRPKRKTTEKKTKPKKKTDEVSRTTFRSRMVVRGGPKPPVVSYVKELQRRHPELNDKKQLISYLVNLMRSTVPPKPPQDYYVIDIDGKFICAICEDKTHTLAAAARHYQNCHGPRYLKCFACGVDFWNRDYLYNHEKRCSAPDAEIVLEARGEYLGRKGRGRPYLTSNTFKPRMNRLDPITGEEMPEASKFKCSFCPAEYVHKETWESHVNMHKGVRPFKCNICPCAYPSKKGLRKHKMSHRGREFICDHCNRSFKLKSILISHLNTHLPQRKYGCDMCPKRYAQKDDLCVHINRDHFNLPLPFACTKCPTRYPRMSSLKTHMFKKHGLKLLSHKTLQKNLPGLKLEELNSAQIVFNKDLATSSGVDNEVVDNEVVDESCFDVANYLDITEEDAHDDGEQRVHQRTKLISRKTPIFNIRLSAS